MRESLKNKSAVVYVAVNSANGKKYIGITHKFKDRKRGHENQAKLGKSHYPLYRAMRKYGPESFNWYILSKWKTYQEALDEEVRVIALIKPEYNSTAGGEGTVGLSHQSHWKGKKLTEESIRKRSETRRKSGCLKRIHSQFNKKSTDKRKKKVLSVMCVEHKIKFYGNRDAAKFYGVSMSHISEVCCGKRRSIGGKTFKYI